MSVSYNAQIQVLNHPLLACLSEDMQQRLLVEAIEREYPSRQLLFRQDDAAERFFIVLSGRIKLFRAAADGREKVVEIIQPGHSFAEAVMFMGKSAYPVCAETMDPVRLVGFTNRVMLECLEGSPQTCLHLLGHLSMRLHQRLNELESLTVQNSTQRLACYFLAQAEDSQVGDKALFDLKLAKGVLASRLSIKPETFSRAMASMRDQGLIKTQGKRILIPSLTRLRDALMNLGSVSGGDLHS